MKSTGIIRRIDNLGRIVIPKEIRKNLRIKNGENLEIFINQEDIILKKYYQIDKLKYLSDELTKSIYKILKKDVMITNNEAILSINDKEVVTFMELSSTYLKLLERHKEVIIEEKTKLEITKGKFLEKCFIFEPIINNGDVLGSIIMVSNEKFSIEEIIAIKIAAKFLESYVEA